jgi:hypothetical protein
MKNIHLALSALVATLSVLLCNLSVAYADIACPSGGAPPCSGPPHGGGGGGGGCSIAMANPSGALAITMMVVGIAFLAVSRRRKA